MKATPVPDGIGTIPPEQITVQQRRREVEIEIDVLCGILDSMDPDIIDPNENFFTEIHRLEALKKEYYTLCHRPQEALWLSIANP